MFNKNNLNNTEPKLDKDMKHLYLKYKSKFLIELNKLNNYNFSPYLKYVIIDDNKNDDTDEERMIKNAVINSSYMLPLKPKNNNNEVNNKIKNILQKAIISTNFKNKINKDISDPESYYVFEYNNKSDADTLRLLLEPYEIKTSIMSDTRLENGLDIEFHYIILKPVDMLLLIHIIIGKPVSLSRVQEFSSKYGDYLRVNPNIVPKNEPKPDIPSDMDILKASHLTQTNIKIQENRNLLSRIPFRL